MIEGTLRLEARSRLYLGGHAPRSPDVDGGTARLPDGTPYVPGSAIKGALRETLSRLLAGSGRGPICDDCNGPAGSRVEGCLLCRIFGRRPTGKASPEDESRLRIGDAVPAAPEPARSALAVQHRVAIRRSTRSQMPKRLFSREVVGGGAGIVFHAPVEADLSEKDFALLARAAGETLAIGGGKTTGAGWIRISLERRLPPEVVPPPRGKRVWVVARPEAPLCLGSEIHHENFRPTLDYIPGTTFRGAVAAALLRSGVDPQGDAFLRAFTAPDGTARFGPLLPRPEGADAVPAPRTSLVCKTDPSHPIQDRLLADLVVHWSKGAYEARLACAHPSHGALEGRLERASGYLAGAGPKASIVHPRTRTTTHVAIDRARGSAAHGHLYTIEEILPEEGFEFAGEVVGLDPALWEALGRAGARIHLGKGRNRGLGRAVLRWSEPYPVQPLVDRLQAFLEAATARARALESADPPPDMLIALLLVSALPLPQSGYRISHELIGQRLAGEVLFAYEAEDRVGGYSILPGSSGPTGLRTAAAAGSVYLVRVRAVDHALLESLEADGLCETEGDRAAGWGRVLFCHPSHVLNAPGHGRGRVSS